MKTFFRGITEIWLYMQQKSSTPFFLYFVLFLQINSSKGDAFIRRCFICCENVIIASQ